ncbi:MAG TPA: sulfite exporter TauE/SafE family protein [Candidatus Tectomicrobia bacterium]
MVILTIFQFLVGALMGLTSVGSGSLVILSMLYFIRMPTRQIVGSNLTVALIMAIPASLTHLAASGVDLPRLLLLLVGSLFGTIMGSKPPWLSRTASSSS